jgi:hypothetical protein
MFFKKKAKEVNQLTTNEKNPQFKNSDSSKNSDSTTEELKKPLVDTSFVFFEDK